MKKILSVILALMMFVLPISSMAEARSLTVSAQHGSLTELLAIMGVLPTTTEEDGTTTVAYADAINELLDSASIRLYEQTGDTLQAGGAVSVSGTDVLTGDVALDGLTVKVASNLLGDDVVTVNLLDVMSRAMENMGSNVNVNVEELGSAMGYIMQVYTVLQSLDLSDLEFTNAQIVLTDIVARVLEGTAEVTEQPEGCDPAATVTTFTLSGTDAANLVSAAVEDLLNCASIRSLAEQNLAEGTSVDDQLAQLKETLTQQAQDLGEITYTMYLDSEGAVVAADMTFNTQDNTGNIQLTRNTEAGQVVYEVTMTQGEMTAVFTYIKADNGASLQSSVPMDGDTFTMGGSYAATDNERQMTLNIGTDTIGVQLVVETLASETGSEMTADLYCTGMITDYLSEARLLTVKAVTESTADVAAISGNEVDVLSMCEEDLATWMTGLSTNVMLVAFSAMQALPTSVLTLFLGN